MDALTLTEAKAKRAQIRAATRLKTFIENFDTNQGSRYEIKERKKKLEDLWSLFDTVQSCIEILENVDPANVDKDVLRESAITIPSKFRECLFSVNITL